jgi:hypothetical protein
MRLIFSLLLLVSLSGFSQWKSFTISVKGDTINRVDPAGLKQGPWVISVPDLRGEKGYDEEGYFENDLKEGLWKRFSLQGIKIAEENYQWGKLSGRCRYYTYNGGLLREENWRAMDPTRKYDTVAIYDLKDPTKLIDMIAVKNEGVYMRHGTWNYYDPAEGVIVQTEKYRLNKLVTDDGEVVGDELKPIGVGERKPASDSSVKKALSNFAPIKEYEKKNSGKKKIKARDGSTGN